MIERVEALIRSLTGIVEARAVAGPDGEIQEIWVLAERNQGVRQVARNVQSALVARLGVVVDHRAISVAAAPVGDANGNGNGAAAPAEAAAAPTPSARDRAAAAPAAPDPKPRLEALEVERLQPHRIRCRITIALADELLTGEAEALDSPDAALEVVARAVLRALAPRGTGAPLELEAIHLTELAGRDYVLAAARTFRGRSVRYLAGAAFVEYTSEDAAAAAALQIAGEWLAASARPRRTMEV